MKEFNLEEAKAGKQVCTRDGRKARIICFDAKYDEYPIIALVEEDGHEDVYNYTSKGFYDTSRERAADLMMVGTQKDGWVNIFLDDDTGKRLVGSPYIHKTKKDALNASKRTEKFIDTIKITWEE